MAETIVVANYSSSNPAAPAGYDLVKPQKDGTKTPPDLSFAVPRADVAGTKYGTVIYDGSGSATRYLGADGNWHAVPTGGGSGNLPAYMRTPVTPPSVSELTWINQSTATAVDSSNGIYLKQPSTATQYLACLMKAAPVTPWKFIAGLLGFNWARDYTAFGICISDGVDAASSKLRHFGLQYQSPLTINVANWNNSHTYSDTPIAESISKFATDVLWLSFADDGTDVIASWLYDGINEIEIYRVSRTTFLIPTHYGIFAKAQNASGMNQHVTCVSWEVS
jgi:hypothetical protein